MGKSTTSLWGAFEGAVSLTFDDGNSSQLDLAIPAMIKHELRGTFFLSPAALEAPAHREAWRQAAAGGHEIGNHSWSHPHSEHFGWGNGIESWTLEQIAADIERAQEYLTKSLPGVTPRTYAYPCYQTDVGRGPDRRSYCPLIADRFLAGRGMGEGTFANDPVGVDLSKAWGTPCEGRSGAEMIGIVEDQVAAGKWVVLVFHTINGARLSVCSDDFNRLLGHLHRNRQRILVDTFGAIAARVKQIQQAGR